MMTETLTVTQLLAVFVGLYLVAAGIGLLSERDSNSKMLAEFQDNTALGFITGAFAFAVGAAMIAIHNLWTSPLAILVSVIAWWTLLKGVCLLAIRQRFLALANVVLFKNSALSGALVITFGAALLMAGLVGVGVNPN
jgi:hypothetical protein